MSLREVVKGNEHVAEYAFLGLDDEERLFFGCLFRAEGEVSFEHLVPERYDGNVCELSVGRECER